MAVPIHTPGTMSQPGLEARPLAPETCALTISSLCLLEVRVYSLVKLSTRNSKFKFLRQFFVVCFGKGQEAKVYIMYVKANFLTPKVLQTNNV